MVQLFDTDVVKKDVAHEVVVSGVDGEASLVVHLRLALAEDVDILVDEVFHGVPSLGVGSGSCSVESYEDGVCDVSPESGVSHADISRRTFEAFAGGVGRGAVVGVAAEDSVVEHV